MLLMREIVPRALFEPQDAPIASAPTDRAAVADGILWLKVSKTTFNTPQISLQVVWTVLQAQAQAALPQGAAA